MRKSRLCMGCIAIMTTAMLVIGCGVSNVGVGTTPTEEETEVVAVEVTSEEKDLGESSTQSVTSGEIPEGTTDEGTGSTQEASADITAEDLVNVLRGVEGEDTMDIHCKISIGVDDGSGAQSASVRMLADYDMVGNHLCMYLTGTTGMSVYGQTVTEDTEAYVDKKINRQYTLVPKTNTWVYSSYVGNNDYTFDVDNYDNFTLGNIDNEGRYVLCATTSVNDVQFAEGKPMIEDGGDNGYNFDGIEMKAMFHFDPTTLELKRVELFCDECYIKDLRLFEYVIIVDYNQIGGDIELSIPDEVLSGAIDATQVK